MTWLLPIFMFTSDGQATQVPVGFMVDEPICQIAGQGFERVLKAEDPSVLVAWKCENVGV